MQESERVKTAVQRTQAAFGCNYSGNYGVIMTNSFSISQGSLLAVKVAESHCFPDFPTCKYPLLN